MSKPHSPKGLRISDEVHKALRIRAAETGESMGEIAERALRKELGMVTDTMAEKVAHLLGNDGTVWETEDGRTLERLAEEHGAVTTTHPDKHYLTRHLFDDGSAIVTSEGAWDIEGKEPWSWTCED